MASDDKKTKAEPAPKTEAPPKSKSTADAKSTSDAKSASDVKSASDASTSEQRAADAAPAKAEGGGKEAGSSAAYHRGEGQKPVSQAYRDNWNLIFGEKKKKR